MIYTTSVEKVTTICDLCLKRIPKNGKRALVNFRGGEENMMSHLHRSCYEGSWVEEEVEKTRSGKLKK